jgi:hypothetical protein
MADYRDLAIALGGGYGQDTGPITPDTLITLKNGKKATAGDLLGMLKGFGQAVGSNLESLGRGGVASVIGAGGDLESFGRMGINKLYGAGGVNVNPTPVLPTTTDILGMMPRATAPRRETAGMEELGGYMAPATAKLAGKAIKATESLPVGMSIKPINLNKGIYKPELTMEEMLKVKDIPTVDRVKQSIDLVGEKEFERMVNAQYSKYKPSDVDQEAMLVESVTLDILGKAQRSPYPQKAALDLAQQRAALPVEQGGLGLPANNTPEMRAQAMGFESGYVHGSPNPDITNLKPSITGAQGEGIYATNYLPEANMYSGTKEGATNYPLYVKTQKALDVGEANPYDVLGFDLQGQLSQRQKDAIISKQKETEDWLIRNGVPFMPSREHYVSTLPENFRSRFAAFDPFRKDVATATAMGVALPDLLAAEKQDKQKKLSKALVK